ncbi:hypothetical protein ABZS29_10315 [Kribbella sp. NPDC005582]|uniref:hypothetical protein n=1 Tax=Kribbella sp. NPDC005582 TaxID=3156893 RepID=UPI0033B5EEC6
MNTFEDKLLAELRTVVAERPADIRQKRPKRVLVGVAACLTLAAGTAVAVPILGGEQATSPAYAVTQEPNGMVRVVVYRRDDAEGLEKKIRATGVTAEVTFVPAGKKCRRTPAAVNREEPGALMHTISSSGAFGVLIDPAKFRGYTLVVALIGPDKNSVPGIGVGRVKTGSYGPCVVVADR